MNPYLVAANQAAPLLNTVGGPVGLLGRIVGLGSDETEAGVPGWAWFGVGCLAGGALVFTLRKKIEKFQEA